jgi:hypothetical protein
MNNRIINLNNFNYGQHSHPPGWDDKINPEWQGNCGNPIELNPATVCLPLEEPMPCQEHLFNPTC